MPPPNGMRHTARLGSGDPLAFAGMGGDLAVQRGRQLQRDQRATGGGLLKKTGKRLPRLVFQQPRIGLDSRSAQPGDALGGDTLIEVGGSDNDTGNAGIYQRIGTRRRLAPVAAGLERDVGGRTVRLIPRHLQRLCLGMGATAGGGEASADNAVVLDNDAADRGVGPSRAKAPPSKGEGGAHMRQVVGRVVHGSAMLAEVGLGGKRTRASRHEYRGTQRVFCPTCQKECLCRRHTRISVAKGTAVVRMPAPTIR